MITTPKEYNPFPTIRRVGASVEFKIVDVNANNAVTATSTTANSVSNLSQLTDGVQTAPKYMTLEKNYILLDGSFTPMPDENPLTGWYSKDVSGSNYTFANPQTLQFDFNVDITSIGFTAYYATAPRKVKITAYNAAGAVISEKTFEATGTKQIYEMPVTAYRKVIFTFIETELPYRRVKLNEVVFGIEQQYDESDLVSLDAIYSADITASALPSRQLTFKFNNVEKKYNLLKPDGIYQYLQDRQQITASVSIDGTPISLGTFYFTKAIARDSAVTAEITANDIIYTLDAANYYDGAEEIVTLSTAVLSVLQGYDIPVQYSAGAANINVRRAIAKGASRREALRLLAQAAMCSVWIDRTGTLHFEPLDVAAKADGKITADELYSYDGITIEPKIDIVELNIKSEYQDNSVEAMYRAGSGTIVQSISNPCVPPERAQAVAEWLLANINRVKRYNVQNRCDPAVEVGDTVNIEDAYKQNDNAVVTEINIKFDGGLNGILRGVGA